METEINGVIIEGKVYKATQERTKNSCLGCDFFPKRPNCEIIGFCKKLHCIFHYSPELTEKLKGE